MSAFYLEPSAAPSVVAKDGPGDEHEPQPTLEATEMDASLAAEHLKSKTFEDVSATVLQASGVQAGIAQDLNTTLNSQTSTLTPLDIVEPDPEASPDQLTETDIMRRFRMGVAFCALFLAGWK